MIAEMKAGTIHSNGGCLYSVAFQLPFDRLWFVHAKPDSCWAIGHLQECRNWRHKFMYTWKYFQYHKVTSTTRLNLYAPFVANFAAIEPTFVLYNVEATHVFISIALRLAGLRRGKEDRETHRG